MTKPPIDPIEALEDRIFRTALLAGFICGIAACAIGWMIFLALHP